MSRIKSAKRYKIWGSRGFCCKFEDGCKAVYVLPTEYSVEKLDNILSLLKMEGR
jgi:hypothetical protein